MWLLPYKIGSEGCKKLAETLGIKRVNKERTAIKGSARKTMINWGNTTVNHPEILKCRILNNPTAVRSVCNKLEFFKKMSRNNMQDIIPQFTESKDEAINWIADRATVVARTVLTGHSGNGIVVMKNDNPDKWVEAPLYTRYVPKRDEYRIHFNKDTGIFFKQCKAVVRGTENPNYQIRNLAGGFIYANQNIETPEIVDTVVNTFIRNGALGLDFGAIDVVYNERDNKAVILEVNTAPGLSGSTLEAYKEMFSRYL